MSDIPLKTNYLSPGWGGGGGGGGSEGQLLLLAGSQCCAPLLCVVFVYIFHPEHKLDMLGKVSAVSILVYQKEQVFSLVCEKLVSRTFILMFLW